MVQLLVVFGRDIPFSMPLAATRRDGGLLSLQCGPAVLAFGLSATGAVCWCRVKHAFGSLMLEAAVLS